MLCFGMRAFLGALAFLALLAPRALAQSPPASPQNLNSLQNYYWGRELEGQGRMAEAVPHYNEVVRVALDEISRNAATRDTFVLLTRALRRLNRHGEVISWGRQGLQAFPDEHRLTETMGQSFFFMGDLDQSLAYMERYANAMPDGDRIALAYFFMGEILRMTHRYHRADMAYTMAVRIHPNMALWWYRLGSVRERAGDVGPALEAYRRALGISPGHGPALAGVARLDG